MLKKILSSFVFLLVAGNANAQVVIQPQPTNLTNPVIVGQIKCADGTVSAPCYSWINDLDSGWYRIGANNIGLALNGIKQVDYSISSITFTPTITVPSITFLGGQVLTGTTANVTTLSNSTADQLFVLGLPSSLYPGFKRSTVAIHVRLGDDSNYSQMRMSAVETGDGSVSNPTLRFYNNSTTGFYRNASGNIGATIAGVLGVTISPGTLTAPNSVIIPNDSSGIVLGTSGNRSNIIGGGDGIIRLYNEAATGFNRIQFGGTTNSFPSLKRSGSGLVSRLADDSANADFTAATIIATAFTFNGTTGKTGTTCTQFTVGGCTAATEPNIDYFNKIISPSISDAGFYIPTFSEWVSLNQKIIALTAEINLMKGIR